MVNTEKGLLEVQRVSCAGMKLSCQLKVQSSLWTATEVSAHRAGLTLTQATPERGSPWGEQIQQLKIQETQKHLNF